MYGLDLFSGIGGITKALEGYVHPLAYCENDKFCQSVLLSRMFKGDLPIAPIWDDVRTLNGNHFGTPIDCIYGGFPCQDISNAGRKEGLAGERSGLFFEIVRLVGELRPSFVFLENVSAITIRGAERVVGEFCKLRYDCRWGVLSACDVGANHRRERWFLLANSDGSGCGESEMVGQFQGRTQVIGNGEDVPNAGLFRQTQYEKQAKGIEQRHWWQSEPNVGRLADGIPARMDKLRALGNAVVPAQAREAFERLMGLK